GAEQPRGALGEHRLVALLEGDRVAPAQGGGDLEGQQAGFGCFGGGETAGDDDLVAVLRSLGKLVGPPDNREPLGHRDAIPLVPDDGHVEPIRERLLLIDERLTCFRVTFQLRRQRPGEAVVAGEAVFRGDPSAGHAWLLYKS